MATEALQARQVVTSEKVRTPVSAENPNSLKTRLFRRRRYWIDARYQKAGTVIAFGGALAFTVAFNLLMHTIFRNGAARLIELAPETTTIIQQTSRAFSAASLFASLVFVIGVAMLGVGLTHRTAGPAVKLQKHMQRVIDGEINHKVTLRKNDNLQPLADTFNRMLQALQERTTQEIGSLRDLAARCEAAGGPECKAIADQLQGHLQDKERSISA